MLLEGMQLSTCPLVCLFASELTSNLRRAECHSTRSLAVVTTTPALAAIVDKFASVAILDGTPSGARFSSTVRLDTRFQGYNMTFSL